MKVAVGCDHAGFPYKDPVIKFLKDQGYEVIDCGCITQKQLLTKLHPAVLIVAFSFAAQALALALLPTKSTEFAAHLYMIT